MKKILIWTILVVMLLCFAGCSPKDNTDDFQNDIDATSSVESQSEKIASNETIVNKSTCVECGRECEIGYSYCSSCGCWESGCVLPKKSMSVYCVNHSCLLCTSAKSYNSPYCSQHKCNKCENVVVDGSNYCVAHKCQMCNQQTFGNSPYCATHK